MNLVLLLAVSCLLVLCRFVLWLYDFFFLISLIYEIGIPRNVKIVWKVKQEP